MFEGTSLQSIAMYLLGRTARDSYKRGQYSTGLRVPVRRCRMMIDDQRENKNWKWRFTRGFVLGEPF